MKARLNYWIDVGMALAFVVSAISGLVFLIPVSWTPGWTGVLGISFVLWNDLHTWSSLVMIASVLLHLVVHWTWIKTMTRRTLGK